MQLSPTGGSASRSHRQFALFGSFISIEKNTEKKLFSGHIKIGIVPS